MPILEIPFSYTAHYVPPRRRLPEEAWLLDSVPVRILDIAVRDAPVAAVWTRELSCRRAGADGVKRPASRTARVAYRAFEGSLLRPWCRGMRQPNEFESDPGPMSLEDARADMAAWRGRAGSTRGAACPEWGLAYDVGLAGRARNAVPAGELQARRVLGDDRGVRRAALSAALDRKATLIGGVLHVPSMGPAWYATAHGAAAVPEYALTTHRSAVFRGDLMRMAMAHCAHVPVMGDGIPGPPVAHGEVEILDAAPFAAVPSAEDAVRDVASQLCSRAWGEHLWAAGPDVIEAFARAKRAALGDPVADPRAAAADLLALERGIERFHRREGHAAPYRAPAEILALRLDCAPAEPDAAARPRGP